MTTHACRLLQREVGQWCVMIIRPVEGAPQGPIMAGDTLRVSNGEPIHVSEAAPDRLVIEASTGRWIATPLKPSEIDVSLSYEAGVGVTEWMVRSNVTLGNP